MLTLNKRKIAKKENDDDKNSTPYNILVNQASANGNQIRIKLQDWCLGGGIILEKLLY